MRRYKEPPPQKLIQHSNLVDKLAALLQPGAQQAPGWFQRWTNHAVDCVMFGDELPIHWGRCNYPRSMVALLAHAPGVVRGACVTHRTASQRTDPGLAPSTNVVVTETVPLVQLTLLDGLNVVHVLDDADPVPCAVWVREYVPVLRWEDLRP